MTNGTTTRGQENVRIAMTADKKANILAPNNGLGTAPYYALGKAFY